MVWQQVVLVVYLAIGGLATIALVGKERKPITPNVASISVMITSVLMLIVVSIR